MENLDHAPRRSGRPLSFDRQAALEQAMLLFWQTGYETTSISDLTAAMGITAPSLYTAFGDKRQLFLEAARLYAGSPYALAEALRVAATAREAALLMLTSAAAAFTGTGTPRGCLLASATASGSRASADVQAEIAAIRRDVIARLAARIEQDIAAGVLPGGTNSQVLASGVVAAIQGMSVLARDRVDRATLVAVAELAVAGWPRP